MTTGAHFPEAAEPGGTSRQENRIQAPGQSAQRVTLQSIPQLNADVINELVTLLNERKPILMAGAGCSVDLGYPGWWTLVESMRAELADSVQFSEGMDVKVAAEMVKLKCMEEHGDSQPFARFIDTHFAPKRTNSGPLQSRLVRLGFGGLVTTNYDAVLEDSVHTAYPSSGCRAINLCDTNSSYLVLEFFRKLGAEPCPHVLHLHGCYDRPDRVVLALSDYQFFYDKVPLDTPLKKRRGISPQDTLHRRTIWALLATRNLVFVGFSLHDDFFVDVMNVWREDLDLRMERPHFALMGVRSEDDLLKAMEKLHRMQVKPIFYEIPSGEPCDHSGLEALVADLAARMGVSIGELGVNEISKRTLEML